MTALAVSPAPVAPSPRTLFQVPDDRGPTLEECVGGLWGGVVTSTEVPCPVCGGDMEPIVGPAARCRDCAASLD
jgi:hypothetical protein